MLGHSPDLVIAPAPFSQAPWAQRWLHSSAPASYECKGKWTWEEDQTLRTAVATRGEAWASVAECVPGRTRKQCRDRWLVHSRSNNYSPLSLAEQVRLIDLHRLHGNHWKRIADQMVDRSERHLKNLFGTRRRAKVPNQEVLLHAYVHGEPTHALTGLDSTVVYAAVHDTRDPVDGDVYSSDVQLWFSICQEAGLHTFVREVRGGPGDDGREDARHGMDAYVAATDTTALLSGRLLLISNGRRGVVGIAHENAEACSVLGRLTCRLWELNRKVPPQTGLERPKKRRRTIG